MCDILSSRKFIASVTHQSKIMFKVNNRNTRTRCEICLNLTVKIPEHISHLVLVFLLLTLSRKFHHSVYQTENLGLMVFEFFTQFLGFGFGCGTGSTAMANNGIERCKNVYLLCKGEGWGGVLHGLYNVSIES